MQELFTYPEGWNEIIKKLDFLPDDPEVREEFLLKYVWSIIQL